MSKLFGSAPEQLSIDAEFNSLSQEMEVHINTPQGTTYPLRQPAPSRKRRRSEDTEQALQRARSQNVRAREDARKAEAFSVQKQALLQQTRIAERDAQKAADRLELQQRRAQRERQMQAAVAGSFSAAVRRSAWSTQLLRWMRQEVGNRLYAALLGFCEGVVEAHGRLQALREGERRRAGAVERRAGMRGLRRAGERTRRSVGVSEAAGRALGALSDAEGGVVRGKDGGGDDGSGDENAPRTSAGRYGSGQLSSAHHEGDEAGGSCRTSAAPILTKEGSRASGSRLRSAAHVPTNHEATPRASGSRHRSTVPTPKITEATPQTPGSHHSPYVPSSTHKAAARAFGSCFKADVLVTANHEATRGVSGSHHRPATPASTNDEATLRASSSHRGLAAPTSTNHTTTASPTRRSRNARLAQDFDTPQSSPPLPRPWPTHSHRRSRSPSPFEIMARHSNNRTAEDHVNPILPTVVPLIVHHDAFMTGGAGPPGTINAQGTLRYVSREERMELLKQKEKEKGEWANNVAARRKEVANAMWEAEWLRDHAGEMRTKDAEEERTNEDEKAKLDGAEEKSTAKDSIAKKNTAKKSPVEKTTELSGANKKIIELEDLEEQEGEDELLGVEEQNGEWELVK